LGETQDSRQRRRDKPVEAAAEPEVGPELAAAAEAPQAEDSEEPVAVAEAPQAVAPAAVVEAPLAAAKTQAKVYAGKQLRNCRLGPFKPQFCHM